MSALCFVGVPPLVHCPGAGASPTPYLFTSPEVLVLLPCFLASLPTIAPAPGRISRLRGGGWSVLQAGAASEPIPLLFVCFRCTSERSPGRLRHVAIFGLPSDLFLYSASLLPL